MIYLDNAATTARKPAAVADAVYRGLTSGMIGNPARGAHDCAVTAFREIYRFREIAARLFGVTNPLHIALTQNATDGLNRVLKGLLRPGDHVITTVTEHNSVLRPLYQLEEMGVALSFVGVDEAANLKQDEFEAYLRKETRAVVVNAASNVTGNPCDIEAIAAFTRKHDLIFILDASQTAGVSPIDMEELGIDVLCTTGHKSLYGPQGTGLIAVNRDLSFAPVFSGGAGAHSFEHAHPRTLPDVFESGTLNTPGAMGLAAGMEYVEEMGFVKIGATLASLMDRFLDGVRDIPQIRIYGDPGQAGHAPVVGLNLGVLPSSEVAALLNEDYGIAVRPGAHCAPRLHEALGTEKQGILRFSFSTFNTLEEIDRAVEALKEITGGME